VVGGARLLELKALIAQRLADAPDGEPREYDVYPRDLVAPYRDRRFAVGEAMYAELGIPREDRAARRRWFARNGEFFGAPLALFCSVDRSMGPPQWSDLGMLLQSVMLLLREQGLDSCPQEYWSIFPQTLGSFLELPAQRLLFTGMAIGHADRSHPVNRLVAARAPLDEVADFMGI